MHGCFHCPECDWLMYEGRKDNIKYIYCDNKNCELKGIMFEKPKIEAILNKLLIGPEESQNA